MPDLNFIKKLILSGRKIDYQAIVSDESHTVSRARAVQFNPSLRKPEILITDDESDICYLLGTILKQKDLPAVFAFSLSDANALIEHNEEFAFIFLDNHLSDGLGVGHTRQIKTKWPSCKIITANDNQSDLEKARFERADHFIGKPFSRQLIFKTIDSCQHKIPVFGENTPRVYLL